MSLKNTNKNLKPLIAPLFLLASGFVFGQTTTKDSAKTKDIEEVVVIGYGKVKKSDLTGSVSSVSAKDLAATPAMNALQALQGRAAGLNIVTAGGAPGASANVTVRGGSSITQKLGSPLYCRRLSAG
ncbi:TonB-dependent receptor plug domain-containing protein [Chryseobacterium wanjuense]